MCCKHKEGCDGKRDEKMRGWLYVYFRALVGLLWQPLPSYSVLWPTNHCRRDEKRGRESAESKAVISPISF